MNKFYSANIILEGKKVEDTINLYCNGKDGGWMDGWMNWKSFFSATAAYHGPMKS